MARLYDVPLFEEEMENLIECVSLVINKFDLNSIELTMKLFDLKNKLEEILKND